MKRIGRYEIKRELGRGGFGRVYAAFDPAVGRMVAIKTLMAVDEPDLLARFRNEASAAGRLRHKNIVTIYDFGEYEGSPFLVMELLDGEDLQRVIASRRELSIHEKVRVLWEAAEGLQHAHANDIVHRDIKPANIMLGSDRSIKIMDFGIALAMNTAIERITPQGNLVGTYRYMAPEQFRGHQADGVADVFAYGVVCYELLSGVHPFHADDSAGVMYRIVHTDPSPLHERCPECLGLEPVVSRILAKDREARYQSFEDVRFDLEPVMIQLSKQRVSMLLAEVQQKLSDTDFTAAQTLVNEALQLDSRSPLARRLRDQIQREQQRRAIQPKLSALVETAERKLAGREFDEAIQCYESAIRLDSTNTGLRQKLQSARGSRELYRRSEQHREQAKRALLELNLTGAMNLVNAALLDDPQNAAAAALLQEIRAECDRREQAHRLLEAVRRARGMLLLESYDEAIVLLERSVEEFPDASELRELKVRAYADKAAHAQGARLLGEMNAIKEMLRRQEFQDAIVRLEAMTTEFPQTAEIQTLLDYALDQSQNQRNADGAAQLLSEALRFMDIQDFAAAIAILEQAQESHSGHSGIRQTLHRAVHERASHERKYAREESLRSARQFRDRNQFNEALRVLDGYVDQYGADNEIRELAEEIEALSEAQRCEECIRSLNASITEAMEENRLATASNMIQFALEEYPGHPDLTALLNAIRMESARQQREDEIKERVGDVADIQSHREDVATKQQHDQEKRADTAISGTHASPPADIPEVELAAQRKRKQHRRRSFVVPLVACTLVAGLATMMALRLSSPPVLSPAWRAPQPPSSLILSPSRPKMPPQSHGSLIVSAGVGGVEIFLNGRRYGMTNESGLLTIKAPARRYRIRFQRNGYTQSQNVEVLGGRVQNLVLTVQPQQKDLPSRNGSATLKPDSSSSAQDQEKHVPLVHQEAITESVGSGIQPSPKHDQQTPRSLSRDVDKAAHILQAEPAPVDNNDRGELLSLAASHAGTAQAALARLEIGSGQARQQFQKTAADLEAISQVLQRYAQAFETRSIQQIEATWPEIPQETRSSLRRTFKENDVHYSVRLIPLKDPEINGNSAVVDCKRTGRTIVDGVAKPDQFTRVRVLFARASTGWVIKSIRDLN